MIKKENKLAYIDALRGIAILLVMMVHTSSYDIGSKNILLTQFFNLGAKGVQLFFIASAFTLFLSNNFLRIQGSSATMNFYIRRFFRIAPMYYLGIMYYYWQSHMNVLSSSSTGIWDIVSNIFFIHGLSPYWINHLVPGGWSITVDFFFMLQYQYCLQE